MKHILNFLDNSNLKIIVLLIILISLYIFISAYFYVRTVSFDLTDSVFRLHVIANSDSQEDQNLKYIVRDNIIKYMNTLCENSSSKDETIELVSNHLTDFENIANDTIKEYGFSYSANANVGNFKFPTKSYADISFPSGYYDALEIELGNANGQNWWCVLYPSLCFVDVTSGIVPDESKNELKNALSEHEYEIISNSNNPEINFRFKLIEFFNKNIYIANKN